MPSSVIYAHHCIEIDQKVQTNTAKYVEAMEARDKEKEIGKIRWAILILHQVGTEESCSRSHGIACMSTMNKMSPLPCLATQECNTAKDSPEHPFFNCCTIHAMTCFDRQHHRYRAHDQNEGHDTNKYKRSMNIKKRNGFKDFFRYRPVLRRKDKRVDFACKGRVR